MRTNIVLDEELVDEAFRLSKARTKRALIHEALTEFVENRKRLNLMNLKGKIVFSRGYDYKGMRAGK